MPKRIVGPFPELASLAGVAVDTSDALGCLELMDTINHALAVAGCHCNGHASGEQRDEYWGADLSELVARCAPHEVSILDVRGQESVSSVRIRLETLRAEIDSNGEVCAWIYEEH